MMEVLWTGVCIFMLVLFLGYYIKTVVKETLRIKSVLNESQDFLAEYIRELLYKSETEKAETKKTKSEKKDDMIYMKAYV